MKINFEDLKDYFTYHKKDKKITVAKVAESLRKEGARCSASYLYMLKKTDPKNPNKKDRFASYSLACIIEGLLNVKKESMLKKALVKSRNWRKNIFRKIRRNK